MIEVRGVSKAFGSQVLFDGADVRLGARDRVALVGPNGSGKTTLLEMIVGAQTPDAGSVEVLSDATVGYLAQETDSLRGRSVLEEVVSSGQAMQQAGHKLEVLEHELAQTPDGPERDELLATYAHLHERFDALGGWNVETEAKRILSGLGFRQRDVDRQTDAMSGGWLMRVALAKLLLSQPDVLLLDEPTNHLDLHSVVWFEGFLRGYDGAVLLVSHDRDFLNGVATRVVELDDADLVSYTGDFEAFVRQREERVAQQEKAAKVQAKRVAQIERFIERFRYKSSKAAQVQSRVKMLDRMERVDTPKERKRAMKVGFPDPPRSGRVVITLDGVDFAYPDTPVYEGLDLEIERGPKVALVGPNGAGKTTMLKLLAGALEPQAGERRLGHNVSVGYFAQHQIEALDTSNRVIEELRRSLPPDAGVKERDLLGRFLFSGDDIDKPVSVLSGGERSRLAMAKLLCEPHNLLCLDEPTNHLDMTSRDVLEDALLAYNGCIVLITHDRHLIRSVANRIVEVTDGRVRAFAGDYEFYRWRIEQETAPDQPPPESPLERASPKERRRIAADQRAKLKEHRDRVAAAERELESAQARIEELEQQLADPDFYTRDDAADAVREHKTLTKLVSKLERDWERAATALEDAEGARA